jgi:small subunit ribosomal protein S16
LVVIRLARHGAHNAPYYRIVVADQRKKRDGRIIEQVGTYDPSGDPSIVDLDLEKVEEWIKKGAQPSDRVAKIIAQLKGEDLPEKIAARAALKDEQKKAAEAAAAKKAAEEKAAAEAEAAAEAADEAAEAEEA